MYALVEKYLPLTQAERIEYNKELEETNVEVVMTEWQRQNYEKGLSQGLAQAAIETTQQSMLLVLETRFGTVPSTVRERVNSISDVGELQRLLRIAVIAPTIADMDRD